MLPKTDANGYQKWLTHPMIRELGCIAIFVVANQAGMDQFLHMQQLCKEIACASLKHSKKVILLNDLSQQVPSDK